MGCTWPPVSLPIPGRVPELAPLGCLAPEALFTHSSAHQSFRFCAIIPFLCHGVKILSRCYHTCSVHIIHVTARIVALQVSAAALRPPAVGPRQRLSTSSILASMSGWHSADSGDHHPGSCSGPLKDGVQIHLISESLPRCWLTLTLHLPAAVHTDNHV